MVFKILKEMNIEGVSEIFRRNQFDPEINISLDKDVPLKLAKENKPVKIYKKAPEYINYVSSNNIASSKTSSELVIDLRNVKKNIEDDYNYLQCEKTFTNSKFDVNEVSQPRPDKRKIISTGIMNYKYEISNKSKMKYSGSKVRKTKFKYRQDFKTDQKQYFK